MTLPAPPAIENLPLVVDLDGTLIKTDLLFETANSFVTQHPLLAPYLINWLVSGKSTLKLRLAEIANINPAFLPYNTPLLLWLREEKNNGRQLVLATASHRILAESIAKHLELFDEILATENQTNLKSAHKRDLLLSRYGAQHFDYVGNDVADLATWQAARHSHVVSGSPALIAKARAIGNVDKIFGDVHPTPLKSMFRALRPHQWMKNLLIFVPLLAAHLYGDIPSLLQTLLAFTVFGLMASSVYLLNDLIDVSDDRQHPKKRNRPFAAGDLSLLHGWLTWPVLFVGAFILASTALPAAFTATVAIYFLLTLAYSLRLKQSAIIDVVTLACLYTLRIVAGASAIGVAVSFWLLTFSMFIFLSLALIKRYGELKIVCGHEKQEKLRGRGYLREDMEMVSSLGTAAGYISVLVLALYIQDGNTAQLYHAPKLIWMACPLLLFWISRAWLIAHRGKMHDDPIVFALKDRASWIIGISILGIFALARLV